MTLLVFFLGGFAFVYEAQDMSGGKDYALKVRQMQWFWHVLLWPMPYCHLTLVDA